MQCPICDYGIAEAKSDGLDGSTINCERCGRYTVSRTAIATLPATLGGDADRIARLAYAVRRMQRASGPPPMLTTHLVEKIMEGPLPSVFEQADNLVLWIGDHCSDPGQNVVLEGAKDFFAVGARSSDAYHYFIGQLQQWGHFKGKGPRQRIAARFQVRKV
jgi:hypothetical protein